MFALAKVSTVLVSMSHVEMDCCGCAVLCFPTEFNLQDLFILVFTEDHSP